MCNSVRCRANVRISRSLLRYQLCPEQRQWAVVLLWWQQGDLCKGGSNNGMCRKPNCHPLQFVQNSDSLSVSHYCTANLFVCVCFGWTFWVLCECKWVIQCLFIDHLDQWSKTLPLSLQTNAAYVLFYQRQDKIRKPTLPAPGDSCAASVKPANDFTSSNHDGLAGAASGVNMETDWSCFSLSRLFFHFCFVWSLYFPPILFWGVLGFGRLFFFLFLCFIVLSERKKTT